MLILGGALAIVGIVFVLWPLFGGRDAKEGAPAPARRTSPPVDPAEERALDAIAEIEFDHETGKLSARDYQVLRQRYVDELLAARAAEAPAAAGTPPAAPTEAAGDEVEAALAAYRRAHRECPECGPRPEREARYCSRCGRALR